MIQPKALTKHVGVLFPVGLTFVTVAVLIDTFSDANPSNLTRILQAASLLLGTLCLVLYTAYISVQKK